jgi:hypothetical protein
MVAMGVSWLMKILPYDPENTPVTTGVIPETFRKRKGVVRGLHPSHSIALQVQKPRNYLKAGTNFSSRMLIYFSSRLAWSVVQLCILLRNVRGFEITF